jgi:hypothetical protein
MSLKPGQNNHYAFHAMMWSMRLPPCRFFFTVPEELSVFASLGNGTALHRSSLNSDLARGVNRRFTNLVGHGAA